MRTVLISIVIMLWCSVTSAVGETLTLNRCIQLSIANNLKMKEAEAILQSQRFNYETTLIDLNEPKVWLGIDSGILYEDGTVYGAIGGNLTLSNRIGRVSIREEDVEIYYPLFVFKNAPYPRSSKKAKLNLALQTETFFINSADVIYQTKEAYYNCLLTKERLGIREELINLTTSLYRLVELKLKEGKIPKLEIIQAQIQLEEANAALLNAQTDFAIACDRLKKIVGLEGNLLEFEDKLEYTPQRLDFEGVLSSILNNYPPIKVQELSLVLAKEGLEEISEMNKPDCGISLNYMWSQGEDEGDIEGKASVILEWPLFDSGARKMRLKKQQMEIRAKEYALAAQKEELELNLQELLRRMDQIQNGIHSIENGLSLAESALYMVRAGYEKGVGTLFEVITAQQTLVRFKERKYEIIFNYKHLQAKLESLTERH